MIYFDTDVLIHSFVNQTPKLHLKANELIKDTLTANAFLVSWLSIQEVGFVLAKLEQPASFISSKLNLLISSKPVEYGITEFSRAIDLAKINGFKDLNDCLHTAIAK